MWILFNDGIIGLESVNTTGNLLNLTPGKIVGQFFGQFYNPIELPTQGFVAGDKFGRRWSHTLLLLCNGILFFVLMWVAYDPDLSGFTIFLCMFIKMNISGTFVLAYMQVKFTSRKL